MGEPKEGSPKEEFPKKEAPKKEAPIEEVLEGQVPESKASENIVLKKKGSKKRWRTVFTVMILAAFLSPSIAFLLNELFKHREATHSLPPATTGVASQQDMTGTEITPLSPQEKKLREAQELMLIRSHGKALGKLEEIISVWPDCVIAYTMKGCIYLELESYRNALFEFGRASSRDPNNKNIDYFLGYTYYKLRDFKEAINCNEKALQDTALITAIYHHGIYHHEYWKKFHDDRYYLKAVNYYESVIPLDIDFATDAMVNLAALYVTLSKQEHTDRGRSQYVKMAIDLLDSAIARDFKKGHDQGSARLMKITGEISVQYGEDVRYEDLQPIRKILDFTKMITRWKDQIDRQNH